MRPSFGLIGFIFATLLAVLAMAVFTVDQRQFALVFQLGEVRHVVSEPGLYVKVPLVQNVRYFDKRILTLDNSDPERFITSERKMSWSIPTSSGASSIPSSTTSR